MPYFLGITFFAKYCNGNAELCSTVCKPFHDQWGDTAVATIKPNNIKVSRAQKYCVKLLTIQSKTTG